MGMLSLAIWTPIAFGIVLLALGRDEQAQSVRWLSLVGAIVSFWPRCLCMRVSNSIPLTCSLSKSFLD